MMTKIIAFPARETPSEGWKRAGTGRRAVSGGVEERDRSRSMGAAPTHLGADEGGSDVEAGVLRVGNPLLVDLHQLPDALQQLGLVEELRTKTR